MTKHKHIIGVDISKAFFDTVGSDGLYNQFTNNLSGFEKFISGMPKKTLVAMEATGYYHSQLAQFLVKKKIRTAVINPLSVKRFRQMKLLKVKTDKADAAIICEYALHNNVKLYKPKSKIQQECQQILALTQLYQKQCSALKNKLQGEIDMGSPSKTVISSIGVQLQVLQAEISVLEEKLNEYIKKLYPGQLQLLKSIPGIGAKTASYLITITDGFAKFEHARQLCSYAGITPTIRLSGTSIRGKSYISKTGNKIIRKLLFLCSFSASKYNAGCRSLYEKNRCERKKQKTGLP